MDTTYLDFKNPFLHFWPSDRIVIISSALPLPTKKANGQLLSFIIFPLFLVVIATAAAADNDNSIIVFFFLSCLCFFATAFLFPYNFSSFFFCSQPKSHNDHNFSLHFLCYSPCQFCNFLSRCRLFAFPSLFFLQSFVFLIQQSNVKKDFLFAYFFLPLHKNFLDRQRLQPRTTNIGMHRSTLDF